MTIDLRNLQENYSRTLDRIATAAKISGRTPDTIRLVVVTKAQPTEVLKKAIQSGIRRFGENYPEEAVEKMENLGFPVDLEWHMIGHLQSRKAELVTKHFQLLHSLDSLKLARRLDRLSAEVGKKLPVLLEVNIGGEASKKGWLANNEHKWPDLLEDWVKLRDMTNLSVQGLMCMPPLADLAENSRPYFIQTRKLQDFLKSQIADLQWNELSMGTSLDYDIAVEEGATLVRVGTSILGTRINKPDC